MLWFGWKVGVLRCRHGCVGTTLFVSGGLDDSERENQAPPPHFTWKRRWTHQDVMTRTSKL